MKRAYYSFGFGLALLVSAGAGWLIMSQMQARVAVLPGLDGCWRLEGTGRQTDCLADEFERGAVSFAEDADNETERADLVAQFVRTADDDAAADEELAGLCHPAMHQLGRSEGRRASRQGRFPIFPGNATRLCTAGYVHGLAEGYLTSTPSAEISALFPNLCHDLAARKGCAHGVGHSLLQARVGETTPVAVRGATGECITLPRDYRTECANGVFMELAMRRKPEPVPVDDFVATCEGRTSIEEELSCFGYLGMSIGTNDVPIETVPGYCMRAPVPGQFPCIEGYGRDIGVKQVARCDGVGSGRAAIDERCVDGALGLQIGSGHVTSEEARTACATIRTASLEAYCTRAVERYSRGRDDETAASAGTA